MICIRVLFFFVFCTKSIFTLGSAETIDSIKGLLDTHTFENVVRAKKLFEEIVIEEQEWAIILGERKKEVFQTNREAVGEVLFYPAEVEQGFFKTPFSLLGDIVVALRLTYAASYKSPRSLILSQTVASLFSKDSEERDSLIRDISSFSSTLFARFSVTIPHEFIHEKIIDEAEKKRRSGKLRDAYTLLKSVEGYAPEVWVTISRYAIQYFEKGRILEEELFDCVRNGNREGFAYASFSLGEKFLMTKPSLALKILMIGAVDFKDLMCVRFIKENASRLPVTSIELKTIEGLLIIYEPMREEVNHAIHQIFWSA